MRHVFTLSILLFLSNGAFSQSDPLTSELMYIPDTSFQYIGAMDSLNSFILSNRNGTQKLFNSSFEPTSAIESNGYRMNGVLYTMRIRVPEDSHAAIRSYEWSARMDSIDYKMIYPPVKKK